MTVPVLPPEIIEALRSWHDALGYSCVATSEGQWCCVDDLIKANTEETL